MRVSDVLSAAEIKMLTASSNTYGLLWVALSWALIAAAFALVAVASTVPAVIGASVLALVVLGNRQLALSVLMHDASHRTLCRTRRLNDHLGRWLCAAPVWSDLRRYREHHMRHHNHTGTEQDPDMCLVAAFPVSPQSLRRKLARDVLGATGLKRIVGLLLMDFGFYSYTASGDAKKLPRMPVRSRLVMGIRHLAPVVLANALLAVGLMLLGHAWLYLLWVGAYLTTYSLFLRVRSMAEHACTTRGPDPFSNTRTTYAGILARLTVAPHAVNYHLEHHLLMTVPIHQLPRMHRMLRERGALDDCHVSEDYGHVLRTVAALPKG